MAEEKEVKKAPKKEKGYSGELKEIYDLYITRGWSEEKTRKYIEERVIPSRE